MLTAKSARLDLDYKPLKRKKKVQKQQEDRPKIATLNFEEKLRPEQKEQRNRSMEGQRISLQRMRERRATLSRGYHGINIDGTRLKTEPPKIQDKCKYGLVYVGSLYFNVYCKSLYIILACSKFIGLRIQIFSQILILASPPPLLTTDQYKFFD